MTGGSYERMIPHFLFSKLLDYPPNFVLNEKVLHLTLRYLYINIYVKAQKSLYMKS